MVRIKSIMLGSLMVVGVLASATTSVSAAVCKQEAGKKFMLCLGEPLVLTEGTLTVRGETDGSSGYQLETSELAFECQAGMSMGSLTSSAGTITVLNVVIKFTGCALRPESCKVREPIQTVAVKGVVEEGVKEQILFSPQAGSIFATITLEDGDGTCLIRGAYQVGLEGGKGGVLCTSPTETTRPVQLFKCHSDELVFGFEAALFEGSYNAKVLSKLGVEEKWAVIEGK